MEQPPEMPAHVVWTNGKKERSLYGMVGKDLTQVRHTDLGPPKGVNINSQAYFCAMPLNQHRWPLPKEFPCGQYRNS